MPTCVRIFFIESDQVSELDIQGTLTVFIVQNPVNVLEFSLSAPA
jgi:hypothetical protein